MINEGLYRDITLHFKPVSANFPHYISEKTEEQLQEPSRCPHRLITHEQGQKAQDDRTTELINAVMCPWAAYHSRIQLESVRSGKHKIRKNTIYKNDNN